MKILAAAEAGSQVIIVPTRDFHSKLFCSIISLYISLCQVFQGPNFSLGFIEYGL